MQASIKFLPLTIVLLLVVTISITYVQLNKLFSYNTYLHHVFHAQNSKMALGIKFLPISIVLIATLIVTITSFLTFSQNHVTGSIPYVSDTGTLPPESCIFGQALNLLWVMISYAMFIKYRQTSYLLNKYNMPEHQILNARTLKIGLLAAFGSSIVANFQETNMFVVHWFGAVLVFGFGSIYQCMQTILYIHLIPVLKQIKLTKLRMALAALSTLSFSAFFVCAMISYSQKKVNDNYLHWKKEDGGYKYHNISVFAEWICASSTMMYITLFSKEFKDIALSEPDVIIKNLNDHVEQVISITEQK